VSGLSHEAAGKSIALELHRPLFRLTLPEKSFSVQNASCGKTPKEPQTEALLQWFEMGATSDAIGGAFSFPDTAALPRSALPCPQ
jgi:hypothetical protein